MCGDTADERLLVVLFRESVVTYATTMIALSLNLILGVSVFLLYCYVTEAVNGLGLTDNTPNVHGGII